MKIVKNITSDFFTFVFTLIWLVLAFGQLQRIQLGGNFAFYLHDLFITVFVGGFLWQQRKNILNFKTNNEIIKKNKLEILFLILVFGGMMVGLTQQRIDLKSFSYLARLIDYSIFIYALQKIKLNYQPYLGFLISGTLIGLWGILQYIFIPDVRFLNIFGWDNHYYRLISTIFDPAFTGVILVITVGLWQRLINEKKLKKLAWVMQTLLVVAIAATFSRASYLAFGILAVLQWFRNKSQISWILLSLIFVSTILLLPKPGGEGVNLTRTSTIEARSENIQENLITLAGPQWLWGRGLFNNDAQKDSYTNNHAQLPDNLIVLIINSTGLTGCLLLGLLLVKWLRVFYKQDPLWTLLLISVLVHSLFNNTFLQPFVFLSLWGSKKINI